ncbi:MAG: M48 family metallopeptidase, partial [Myxococcales bacterium]|nr:M48 family metallopeptidase [Myxococcales bacterium]
GGRLVTPNTTNAEEKKLINVVEEMAIASGVPVPLIYVLDNESGINAFAAGKTQADAAIGVTRGCIEQLSRDELQGVIAHEFSHILHGDMRLNIRLMGVVHGILIIGIMGYWFMRSAAYAGRSRNRNSGGAALGMLAAGGILAAIGYIGVFFGNLIKAGVSRQREFLADASAVQFTRNPSGLVNALKRLGGYAQGSRIENRHNLEMSHMFFGDGVKRRILFSGLLATHPPLEKRIAAIDATFDPKAARATGQAVGVAAGVGGASNFAGGPAASASPSSASALTNVAGDHEFDASPAQLTADVGTPKPEHVSFSAALIRSFPGELVDAAHDPIGSQALIMALLLDSDPSLIEKQLADVTTQLGEAVASACSKLAPTVGLLGPRARLPLTDLSVPALRMMDAAGYGRFAQGMELLIQADNKVTLFEYCLRKIITTQIGSRFSTSRTNAPKAHDVSAVLPEISVLLSLLAFVGHDDETEVRKAFAAAESQLGAKQPLQLVPKEHNRLSAFDVALDRLNAAVPGVKRRILTAAAHCVAADGKVTVEEAEVLRAVAGSLECPLPPFLSE